MELDKLRGWGRGVGTGGGGAGAEGVRGGCLGGLRVLNVPPTSPLFGLNFLLFNGSIVTVVAAAAPRSSSTVSEA